MTAKLLSLARSVPSRLGHGLRALARHERGVAAVEFALVLPVMVILYCGLIEVTVGVNSDRKLTLLTRSLADLTSRFTSLTTADVSNIFAASSAVMQPYDGSKVTMAISSVSVTTSNNTSVGTVSWSCASGPSSTTVKKRTAGTTYAVPAGFSSSSSFILVETEMSYAPFFGGRFTGGTLKLSETTPWPVRNADYVTGPPSC